MAVLESSIESSAITYSVQTGWITFKINPNKSNGFPDRVFINRWGLHVYIEFKKPGEVPRNLQLYRINQLRERRVIAFWTDTFTEARKILDAYVDSKRLPDAGYPLIDIPGFSRPVPGPRARKD